MPLAGIRAGGGPSPQARAVPTATFTDPRETRGLRAVSCGPSIVVMEATEHWEGHDVPLGRALCGDGGQLVDPLVRARGVVVGVRHGACEHEDGFKHGRSKVTPTHWISRGSRK